MEGEGEAVGLSAYRNRDNNAAPHKIKPQACETEESALPQLPDSHHRPPSLAHFPFPPAVTQRNKTHLNGEVIMGCPESNEMHLDCDVIIAHHNQTKHTSTAMS